MQKVANNELTNKFRGLIQKMYNLISFTVVSKRIRK